MADLVHDISYCIQINIRYLALGFEIALPYNMYWLGLNGQLSGYARVLVGAIPIMVLMAVYFIRQYANKTGKGDTVPIPSKRFTTVSSDGEVTAEYSRLQELLLYVADVEDYLERKGWL